MQKKKRISFKLLTEIQIKHYFKIGVYFVAIKKKHNKISKVELCIKF